MIDFVKLRISSFDLTLLTNIPELEFKSDVNERTGENIPFPKIAIYRNLTFEIKGESCFIITGSLHKFHADGCNWNQFTLTDLVNTIKLLSEIVGISSSEMIIENIEIGVNLPLDFDPDVVIMNLIQYNGKSFSPMKSKRKSLGKDVYKQRYGIKVYNKSSQYDKLENIVRVEAKVTKMAHLKKLNVKTLKDLTNPETYLALGDLFLGHVDDILFDDDTIDVALLTPAEKNIVINGRNPREWEKVINRSTRHYKLKRFRALIESKGSLKLSSTIHKMIYETINKLCPVKMFKIEIETGNPIEQINSLDNSIISSIHPHEDHQEKRSCISCGRDISKQKKGSIFCSEKVYGKEAKKCRNIDSNPRNNFWSRENKIKSMGLLFDINPYLQPTLKNAMKIQHYAI